MSGMAGGICMNIFKYRVYYKYLGPSKDDPFAINPLSPDRVQHYLDGLCAILPPHFSTTAKDDSLYITVVTSESQDDIDSALNRCVVNINHVTSGLSLLIDRLSER